MSDDNIFHLDLDRLEWHWVEQAELYDKAAERLADIRLELDTAEAKLEIIYAGLSLEIRKRPRKYGLKSTTEAAIKACVILQSTHKKQQWLTMKLKHKVGIMYARVTALDHRKKALEKLTDLHGQGYFSRPREKNKVAGPMDLARKKRLRRDGET